MPVFGLANAYPVTLGIEATDTDGDCNAWGASVSVFQATSGSTGCGNDARY